MCDSDGASCQPNAAAPIEMTAAVAMATAVATGLNCSGPTAIASSSAIVAIAKTVVPSANADKIAAIAKTVWPPRSSRATPITTATSASTLVAATRPSHLEVSGAGVPGRCRLRT